jgi:hypothetical protein
MIFREVLKRSTAIDKQLDRSISIAYTGCVLQLFCIVDLAQNERQLCVIVGWESMSNPIGLIRRSTRATVRVGYEKFEGRGVFGLLGSVVVPY